MKIALFSALFVIGAGIIGFVFKPTEDQLRPLEPEPGTGGDDHGQGHADHGHAHH
jgi:hypothetical protein